MLPALSPQHTRAKSTTCTSIRRRINKEGEIYTVIETLHEPGCKTHVTIKLFKMFYILNRINVIYIS